MSPKGSSRSVRQEREGQKGYRSESNGTSEVGKASATDCFSRLFPEAGVDLCPDVSTAGGGGR